MTLEQLAILSQLIGTSGIIASLIFVGVQILQNMRADPAQVRENMTREAGLCSGLRKIGGLK